MANIRMHLTTQSVALGSLRASGTPAAGDARRYATTNMEEKMKILCSMVVAFFAIVITACSPLRPKLQELQVPPERISQKYYSLIPLNEKGWLVLERNQWQLTLARGGANPDESVVIQAWSFTLPEYGSAEEFVILVKEAQSKENDPLRFTIKKHEVGAYPQKGAICAKSHLVAEDNAAPKRSGKSGSMVLAGLTLTCAHPRNKYVGVGVTYSHRYYPEQEDPSFIEKATSVLNSVEFGEL